MLYFNVFPLLPYMSSFLFMYLSNTCYQYHMYSFGWIVFTSVLKIPCHLWKCKGPAARFLLHSIGQFVKIPQIPIRFEQTALRVPRAYAPLPGSSGKPAGLPSLKRSVLAKSSLFAGELCFAVCESLFFRAALFSFLQMHPQTQQNGGLS